MSSSSPDITVLMSAFNAERYIIDSIESILSQTFTNFAFLIIDDGSTDSTAEIVESYRDPRIRLVRNQKNIGLTRSLNKGIKLAESDYIARMDADDISLPNRLEKQFQCFKSDPSLTLCASRMEVIDENGCPTGIIYPTISPSLLPWRLLFGNQIPHTSVMLKRQALIELGGYAEWAKRSQDYELWARVNHQHKVLMIPDILVYWRDHSSNITQIDNQAQRDTQREVVYQSLQRLTGFPISRDFALHLHELVHCGKYAAKDYTIDALKLLDQINLTFCKHYQPHSDAQRLIKESVQAIYESLMSSAIRQLSFSSLMVGAYVFFNYPRSALGSVIKSGQSLLRKISSRPLKNI